jgi:hypothetical protein
MPDRTNCIQLVSFAAGPDLRAPCRHHMCCTYCRRTNTAELLRPCPRAGSSPSFGGHGTATRSGTQPSGCKARSSPGGIQQSRSIAHAPSLDTCLGFAWQGLEQVPEPSTVALHTGRRSAHKRTSAQARAPGADVGVAPPDQAFDDTW